MKQNAVFAKLYEYTKNLGERFEQSVKQVMITLESELVKKRKMWIYKKNRLCYDI